MSRSHWMTLCGLLAAAALGGAPGLLSAQEAPAAHEVRRGDTLWEIAARFLADPLRWPEIHRLNSAVIEDPHWIFPGERLRLPGGEMVTVGGVTGAANGSPATGGEGAAAGAGASGDPFGGETIFDRPPAERSVIGGLEVDAATAETPVSRSDFYRVAFLADPDGIGPTGRTARVVQENPLELELPPAAREYDRVVIERGGLEIEPGDTLQAIRWLRSVGGHGRVAASMALLEVTGVADDSARATVIQIFGNYEVGDPVMRAESFSPLTGVRPEPTGERLVTRVVAFETPQPLIGLGDAVFLEAGTGRGVRTGDEFTLFPESISDPAAARAQDRLAVARVVRVRDATSTALIVDVQDPGVQPGASAVLVRRIAGSPPE